MKKKILIFISFMILPLSIKASSLGISCPSSVTVGDSITCTITAYHDTLSGVEGTLSYSGMNYVSSVNNTGSGMFNVDANSLGGAFDATNGSKSIATYTFSTSSVGTANITIGCGNMVDAVNYDTLSCTGSSKTIIINPTPTPTPTPTPQPSTNTNNNNNTNNNVTQNTNSSEKNHDATLTNIEISKGNLEFSKEKLSYDVLVDSAVDNISIKGVLNDAKATVKLEGDTNLKVGLNTFKLIVTAEDGTTIKEYIINVTRSEKKLSNNSKIKTLKISNYNFKFNEDKTNYNLLISNEFNLTLSIELADKLSTYKIDGNKDLRDGSVIKIKVVAEDGSSTIYKINIEKGNKQNNLCLIISIVFNIILIIIIAIITFNGKKNNFNVWNIRINKTIKKGNDKKIEMPVNNNIESNILEDNIYNKTTSIQKNISNNIHNENVFNNLNNNIAEPTNYNNINENDSKKEDNFNMDISKFN